MSIFANARKYVGHAAMIVLFVSYLSEGHLVTWPLLTYDAVAYHHLQALALSG